LKFHLTICFWLLLWWILTTFIWLNLISC